ADMITVLILTRNEAANLKGLLPAVSRVLAQTQLQHATLVVDATSTDGTAKVARELGARVLQQSKAGYANALREGLAACRGDFILAIDADQSHRPEFILTLLAERRSADIVIASRYIRGARLRCRGRASSSAWY
ncbi:MAG: glycosyltransferase, partial [Planctomycetota bacterium]